HLQAAAREGAPSAPLLITTTNAAAARIMARRRTATGDNIFTRCPVITSTLLCLGPVFFMFLAGAPANLPVYAPLPSGLLTITKYGYVVFHLYYILANVVKRKQPCCPSLTLLSTIGVQPGGLRAFPLSGSPPGEPWQP